MIVVDASLFTAWLLAEPDHGPTDAVWDIVSGEAMFVPPHWPNEIANALRRAVRTRRIGVDEVASIAEQVSHFNIDFAESTPPEQIGALALEALQSGLSTYDMVYLRIARDYQYPLATVDRAMREAARRLNVRLLPE